jgi:hypothetical protein
VPVQRVQHPAGRRQRIVGRADLPPPWQKCVELAQQSRPLRHAWCLVHPTRLAVAGCHPAAPCAARSVTWSATSDKVPAVTCHGGAQAFHVTDLASATGQA